MVSSRAESTYSQRTKQPTLCVFELWANKTIKHFGRKQTNRGINRRMRIGREKRKAWKEAKTKTEDTSQNSVIDQRYVWNCK